MRADKHEFVTVRADEVQPGDLVPVLTDCGNRRMNRWKKVVSAELAFDGVTVKITTKSGKPFSYKYKQMVEVKRLKPTK